MSRREAHLRALAEQLGAELTLTKDPHPCFNDGWPYGQAWSNSFAQVWLWDGRSPAAYFTGLHELGHLAHRHHTDYTRDYTERRVEAEAEAWDWAFENAQEAPSTSAIEYAREALCTYVRDFGKDTAGPTYARVAQRIGLRV